LIAHIFHSFYYKLNTQILSENIFNLYNSNILFIIDIVNIKYIQTLYDNLETHLLFGKNQLSY